MKDTIISAIPGKKYKGLLTINENRETEIDVKPNPKWPIPPLDKWIEDSKTNLDYKINFTLEEPLPIIITKALLKTAYLHCFVSWDYEFALSEQAQMIREVLYGLREFPLPNGYLAVLDGDSSITEGPMFIHSPREWQTLAVNIPLKVSDPDYQCHEIVPIPAPTATGWDDITKLKEWVGDETGMLNIGLTYMPFYLATGNLNGYSQSWRDHYKS